MDAQARFLMHRLYEELAWLRTQDASLTMDDAMRYLRDQCGQGEDGCRFVHSEYCVLDCPFRPAPPLGHC